MTVEKRHLGQRPDLRFLFLPPHKDTYVYFRESDAQPFSPLASEHSPANAWWLADCALLAYHEPKDIETYLQGQQFFDPKSLQWIATESRPFKHNTQAFYVHGDSCAVIAFRGTEFPPPSLTLDYLHKLANMSADVLTDLNAIKRPAMPGNPDFPVMVHRGIAGELQNPALWSQIEQIVSGLNGKPLWLTGHSLGGALATLLAFSLAEHVAGVYVFGALPVGGQDFVEAYAERRLHTKTYRYVHGNDPAPKLFAPSGSAYLPVGQLIQLPVGDRGWISQLGFDRIGFLINIDPLDHHPLFYCYETWNQAIAST